MVEEWRKYCIDCKGNTGIVNETWGGTGHIIICGKCGKVIEVFTSLRDTLAVKADGEAGGETDKVRRRVRPGKRNR